MTLATGGIPYCHLTLLAVGTVFALLFTQLAQRFLGANAKRNRLMVIVVLALIAADALAGWTWWNAVGARIQDSLG